MDIYDNGQWKPVEDPYVYFNGAWRRAKPFIWTNGQWREIESNKKSYFYSRSYSSLFLTTSASSQYYNFFASDGVELDSGGAFRTMSMVCQRSSTVDPPSQTENVKTTLFFDTTMYPDSASRQEVLDELLADKSRFYITVEDNDTYTAELFYEPSQIQLINDYIQFEYTLPVWTSGSLPSEVFRWFNEDRPLGRKVILSFNEPRPITMNVGLSATQVGFWLTQDLGTISDDEIFRLSITRSNGNLFLTCEEGKYPSTSVEVNFSGIGLITLTGVDGSWSGNASAIQTALENLDGQDVTVRIKEL